MKFRFSKDFVVDSDLEPWRREGLRMAMLGGPGSGKSWNNSLIAEQFLTQGGTVIIFQPRDEYFTLKEKFDVLSVGGVHAKDIEFALTSPSVYAKAVVEDGVSMIFYTSAAEDEEKLISWVSRFIRHILNYQEHHKRPLLLILEEAQEYAPRSASGHVAPPWVYNRMIKAFKDCFTQGRKLNIIAIASSQRPQELNFTVRQLANLTFFGKFSDQDIGYVDKECLKYIRKRGIAIDASRLVTLGLGEWLVVKGKRTGFVKVTEPRLTKHGAETPRLEYVAPRTTKAKKTIDQLTKTIMDALKKEEAEKSELEKSKRTIRDLKKKLEAAEEQAKIKLSVKEMLESGEGAPELAEKVTELEMQNKSLREQNEEMRKANLDRYHGELKEANKKIKKLENLIKVQSLARAKDMQKLEAFDNLQKALAPLLPAGPPGLEPGSLSQGQGISMAEIDERINQRLSEAKEITVVKVNVDERIKELVKRSYVQNLEAKIKALPAPAVKAALWMHQKKAAKIGDLYYYMYEKAGRIPGNFYANVVNPLQDAWLILNDSGNVRWTLDEKLTSELKDVLGNGDVQDLAKYLTSLLL